MAIRQALLTHFDYLPTDDQSSAIRHLTALELSTKPAPVYILKGYAGTGKTSLISAYVNYLSDCNKNFVLLAPTGRAAKVLSQYTGFRTATIHRHIYQLITTGDGSNKMILAHNASKNTVFVVDEASMINDESRQNENLFSGRKLLDDLMTYVFSNVNNKMVLVGDTAQLPPVGLEISPALDPGYLRSAYHLTLFDFEMKEVMRQTADSGVLYAATRLREKLTTGNSTPPFFQLNRFKSDINRIADAFEFEDLMNRAFAGSSGEEAVLVCRSNKRANLFNRQIREKILQRESTIEGGDALMVVKNNYFWLDDGSNAGFIANGDLVSVLRITKREEMYGFEFADADILLSDYPEEKAFSVKLLLNTLDADGPGLSADDYRKLLSGVEKDYEDVKSKSARRNKMRKDPYLNALHVKFGYALTCHKTQGGQWPLVIVDQGYLTDEMINTEYLRWLYTALTRSTDKLYLINFNDRFFEE
ncbi:MAG: AAA family ATPase [Bacteroidales bacterium]|nr:AAA family ATPase [Bacteroidales bacterium]